MYPDNDIFKELQLIDYPAINSIRDRTLPGGPSWDSFEILMTQIRRIKSLMFSEGQTITIGDVHRGGLMTKATKQITFVNHQLDIGIAAKQIQTKTTAENTKSWPIKIENSKEIDLRHHKVILLNAASASAGDAVLSLELCPSGSCNEVHQLKSVKSGSHCKFHQERDKAASPEDIFILVSTARIPSVNVNGSNYEENIPTRSILVVPDNWEPYFGPYAGRLYLVANQLKAKQAGGKRRRTDGVERESGDVGKRHLLKT